MFGIHIRIFHDYGSYKTIVLSKTGKARIWVEKLPNTIGVDNIVCLKCKKVYFIK